MITSTSLDDLAYYFEVSRIKMNNFFNTYNMERPPNRGSKRKPCYCMDDEYIQYVREFISKHDTPERNKKRASDIKRERESNEAGRRFIKNLEDIIK
jgi:hypothetical protein